MDGSSIATLSVGLAMDATAVAAARGLATEQIKPRHALVVAVFFGGAQALMPLLGWTFGSLLGSVVSTWSHWVASVLLAFIGLKMIWEARAASSGVRTVSEHSKGDPFDLRVMSGLAIATSIDAFAAGITLPLMNAPMLVCIVAIGLTTALLSVFGLFLGQRFGSVVGRRLDWLGGVLLIALAAKFLTSRG